jgi:predicted RecB family endonuclease
MPPESGYKFVICKNTIVRVLTALDYELIPTEDLNTIQNQALRTKLTSLVAKLYQDRSSELIEDLLAQLKRL